MPSTTQRAYGRDYLDLATRLLQRARLQHPTAGLWEAADVQWWWRKERVTDAIGQDFWLEGGEPVAAVLFTEWRAAWSCDVVVLPGRADLVPGLWEHGMRRAGELRPPALETAARDDDALLPALAAEAGFVASGPKGGTTWMDARDRPAVSPLADGYRLEDRRAAGGRPHHMVPRAGEQVAGRLAETSLYRADLDLCIEAPSGATAAYGLFWHDPVTGVGFVEPMRTEEAHQGCGLAKHVLTVGLDRLARLGATRLRVNYELGNTAAERLYLGAGFQVESTSSLLVRAPRAEA